MLKVNLESIFNFRLRVKILFFQKTQICQLSHPQIIYLTCSVLVLVSNTDLILPTL